MFLSADKYFVLSVLLCVFLLGGLLLVCWHLRRQQRYLPWLAMGYMLSALALAWQTVLPDAEIARWSLATGSVYLVGAWGLARGMGGREGVRAHAWLALLTGAATLALLYHYAFVDENRWVRAYWLGAGLGLIQALPVPAMLRQRGRDGLEKLLCWSYALFAGYTMARPVLLLALAPVTRETEFAASGYWMATLAGTLLFALWFIALLLACTVRDMLAALREERNRDPLTQLLNRRAFFEAAEHSLRDARRGPWALLACDIDHFKQVNDRWGHGAGDAVLRGVARVLACQVREGDMVARFGGEEFVLLLENADGQAAVAVAQRIRRQLASMHIEATGGMAVTASFGIAMPASGSDLPRALTQADALLYQAKQAGRDQVCLPGAQPESV